MLSKTQPPTASVSASPEGPLRNYCSTLRELISKATVGLGLRFRQRQLRRDARALARGGADVQMPACGFDPMAHAGKAMG